MKLYLAIMGYVFFVSCNSVWGYAGSLQCGQDEISRISIMGLSVDENPIDTHLNKKTLTSGTTRNSIIALRVNAVDPGSVAQESGLQPGDLIYKVHGLYFEKPNTMQRFNNILGHSTEKVTLHYFTKSGHSRSISFPRPKSPCEWAQLVYKKGTNLLDTIEVYHPSMPIGQPSIAYLTDRIVSPTERAGQLPHSPDCESIQDQEYQTDCQAITEKIKTLSDSIPSLISALEETKEVARRDTSELTAELKGVHQKVVDALKWIQQNKWGNPAVSLEQVHLVERQWHDHQSNRRKWEVELAQAAKEYQALSEGWDEDLKNIRSQLVKLQYRKQDVANQREQQKREQQETADAQALTTMLGRHKAQNLTLSPQHTLSLVKNPYAYQPGNIFIQGLYIKHIAPHQALIDVAPVLSPIGNLVQIETPRNLALEKGTVRCVVEVLGTTVILQGGIERAVPHVKEVECLP